MAKLARNRIMFFGAKDMAQLKEEVFVKSDNSALEADGAVTVTAATFGTKIGGKSGEYTFTYDGKNWVYKASAITDMSDYGITITGTPAKNDALVITYVAASSPWEALGKDNDDLSKELNADTETTANVLGETTFTHSGFEPEVSLDPYYIDPGRKLYNWIRDIAMNEKYDEATCVGKFAECYFETANPEKGVMTGVANVRDAWYIPQSIGGDTAGAAIPVNITPFGPTTKYKVVYTMETNEPVFTKEN